MHWPEIARPASVIEKPTPTVGNANAPATSSMPRMTSLMSWPVRAERIPTGCASPAPRSAESARASRHHGDVRSSGVRGELDVQCFQPAKNVERHIVEPTIPRRPVPGFLEPNVFEPVQDPIDGDTAFDPGQWPAGATVHAAGECHVLARIRTIYAELGRAVEVARIAVGGAGQQHHRRTGRDRDTTQRGRDAGQPEVALDRRFQPQHLLDEVRNA